MAGPILLVEDTQHNMDLMRYLLAARGHVTAEATTGTLGIEAARREHPDLILLDIHLPDIDGFEVLRRIRADGDLADVAVIAVTALAMVGDHDRILAAGFDGYIPKPLVPQTFAQEVERFLPAPPSTELRAEATIAEAPAPQGEVRADAPTGGREPAPKPRIPTFPATVLVVDNVADNRDLVRSLLEPLGYSVLTAPSMLGAMKELERSLCDLILCDLNMPVEDGLDLLEAVQGDMRLRRVPFAFLTATASWDEVGRLRASGVDDVILRPLESPALVARIEALLGSSRGGNSKGVN